MSDKSIRLKPAFLAVSLYIMINLSLKFSLDNFVSMHDKTMKFDTSRIVSLMDQPNLILQLV